MDASWIQNPVVSQVLTLWHEIGRIFLDGMNKKVIDNSEGIFIDTHIPNAAWTVRHALSYERS